MPATEDHSSPQGSITRELESTGKDISGDTHADDADLSNVNSADLLDELLESEKRDHPSNIGVLPLQEEEGHLREVLTEHNSPENTTVPGEKPGTATGEKTLEKLQPLVSQALEIALEAAIPNIVHRVESALVLKITQQTKSIIAEQLPDIIDRIVTREIEKFK